MNPWSHWILRGREPVPCDFLTWARSFEDIEARQIAIDVLDGAVTISTVFLGLDHGFGGGRPVLFETLVFGGPLDGEMDRYCTYDEAEAGHTAMLQRVVEAVEAGEQIRD